MDDARKFALGEAATAVLSSRYEQHLLQPGSFSAGRRVVPAVVITGFLGSGKTTLVQHLLEVSGGLRICVLVNEVGDVDVDSQIVNAKQRNAAVGVTSVDLSGGCACCTVSGAFEGALRQLAGGSAYNDIDYLLVETSGAADAGSLASTLASSGFTLDLIVCVVDAEAGAGALTQGVAVAQLKAADVVVLNKVDLATMGQVCDLEDAIRQLAPSVRMMRCRFGQVPVEAVLDTEPLQHHKEMQQQRGQHGGQQQERARWRGVEPQSEEHVQPQQGQQQQPAQQPVEGAARPAAGAAAGGATAATAAAAAAGRDGTYGVSGVDGPAGAGGAADGAAPSQVVAAGEIGFLSHEGPVTIRSQQPARPRESWQQRRRQQQQQLPQERQHHHQHQEQQQQQHHHHHHQQPRIWDVQTDASTANNAGPTTCATSGAASGISHPGSSHAHEELHSSFSSVSVVVDEPPLCMACFSHWVKEQLLPAPGIFRAKGVVWLQQRRRHRYLLHLSGKQRVECKQEGTWQGPPGTRVVIIGSKAGGDDAGEAAAPGGAPEALRRALLRGCVAGRCECGGAGSEGVAEGGAAWEFGRCVREHVRFRALPPPSQQQQQLSLQQQLSPENTALGGGGATDVEQVAASEEGAARGRTGGRVVGDGLVEFTCESVPLHGVVGDAVNAQVLRHANAARDPALPFLFGVGGAAVISAATGLATAERPVAALQACFRPQESAAAGAAAWAALVGDTAAGPVLRRAYAHVTSCKCDVVAEMQLR